MTQRIEIQKGRLFESVVRRSAEAAALGALKPIATDYEYVEDAGVRFYVRRIRDLKKKDKEKRKTQEADKPSAPYNPFLPYEDELYVGDVSDSHVALLNKFNVVESHLLIVTRHFEHQETLLTESDFRALCRCLDEYDGLGFYNGGEAAGASQRHKHLQYVPLPLAPEGPSIPIEPVLEEASQESGGSLSRLPFRNVFFRHDVLPGSFEAGAGFFFDRYSRMLALSGLRTPSKDGLVDQSAPYCLLATRRWMFLVPRSTEFYKGISINSLGYAGCLLASTAEDMNTIRECGPMSVLKEVGVPVIC